MNISEIIEDERNPRKVFELLVNSNEFTGSQLYDISKYMFELLQSKN